MLNLLERNWLKLVAIILLLPLSLGLYLFFRDPVPLARWSENVGAIILVFSWSLALSVTNLRGQLYGIRADYTGLTKEESEALLARRYIVSIVTSLFTWASITSLLVLGFIAVLSKSSPPVLIDNGFQVISEDVTFDLSSWNRRKNDKDTDSLVIATKEIQIEKINPGPSEYKMFFGSSQRVSVECTSHKMARKIPVGEEQLPAYVGLSQGYLFEVDLEYLDPFESAKIVFESEFYNSFQGQYKEWGGSYVMYPMTSLKFHIRFPESIRAKNFRVYAKRRDGVNKDRPLDSSEYDFSVAEDGMHHWEIYSPRIGRLYRVEWEW